jgi:hypothetical protein
MNVGGDNDIFTLLASQIIPPCGKMEKNNLLPKSGSDRCVAIERRAYILGRRSDAESRIKNQ